ncbi:SARP family transcriptional regulator, partial [Chloroflexi bacterium TSY]|nr:SARP family transcriptional regulator [Chloroflexi bacterium TSY]
MQHTLYLFGYPQIKINGQPTDIKSRKGLALLAYLAVTRQPQSRDTLAGLLWPEYDQTRARANLRRTLYNLNRTAVVDWLVNDQEMLHLKEEIR